MPPASATNRATPSSFNPKPKTDGGAESTASSSSFFSSGNSTVKRSWFILTALVAALLWPAQPVRANDSVGALVAVQGEDAVHHVLSMRERRFDGIVEERLDFSCGAAVLATLFRDGYAAPVTERDVFAGMLNVSDAATVSRRGFSLLDIKNYAKTVGLGAEGFNLPIRSLGDLKVPGVVLLNYHGYHHFALLRHLDDQYAYVADPALGNRVLSLPDFASEWNGIVLVILGQGYRTDNVLARVKAPLGTSDLLAASPNTPLPEVNATLMFIGAPAVQRI